MHSSARSVSIIVRGLQIAGVFARYLLLHRFGPYRHERFGARLRKACEVLGLAFIKVGQILSTRYDLLAQEDCEELQKLLDEVPPIPYAEVERIFQEDFGLSPESCFDRFNPVPIAAASVSQVYQAVLRGQNVAVKVRRPGVQDMLHADIKIFRRIARIAQLFSTTLRRLDLQEILSQAETWMESETDFLNEAIQIETLLRYYAAGAGDIAGEYGRALVFPRTHREWCSKNVLTMDFLEGVSVRNFRTVADDPAYDAEQSLVALVRAVLRNWMEQDELYFHGDPHPSNILLLPGGKVGLLDLGLMGRFDRGQVEKTRDLFLAVYVKDLERVIQCAFALSHIPSSKVTKGFREDIAEFIASAHRSGLGYWFSGFIAVFIKHKLPLPYDLVLFGRMQTILDGLFQMVMPEKTTMDILGKELARALRRRIFKNLREIDIAPLLYIASEKMRESPRQAAELIDRYFDQPLDLVRDVAGAVWDQKKKKEA